MDTATDLPLISELIAQAWDERPEAFTWTVEIEDLDERTAYACFSVALGRACVIEGNTMGDTFELFAVTNQNGRNLESGCLGEIDPDMLEKAQDEIEEELRDAWSNRCDIESMRDDHGWTRACGY